MSQEEGLAQLQELEIDQVKSGSEEAIIVHRKRKRDRKKFTQVEIGEGEEDELESDLQENESESESEEGSTLSEESSESSACEEFGSVEFEFEDEIFRLEPITKPKKLKHILTEKPEQEEDDPLGRKRYLYVTQALQIPPVQRFYESLSEEEIDLSYYGVNPKNIIGFCAAMRKNGKVRSLNLKDNQLTKEACHHLGILLHINNVLSHLDLTGCRIGSEGIETIAEALSENETLKILNLSKCYIGDEGMKLLAGGIKFNNGLHVLNLSHNRLGSEAAEALGLAFRINSNICELNLNYNDIFDPGGVRALFKGFMENEGITKLILSWNALSGEEIGKFVAAFLRKSRILQYLDLSSNRLDDASIDDMRPGLQNAKALQILKLGKNPISPDALDGLLAAVSGLENFKILDLEDLWAKKSFNQALNKMKDTKNIQVNFAGVFSNYEIIGPDYKKLLFERARYEALKPKNKKARKDLGRFLWNLGDEPMAKDAFMENVEKFKAKISPSIFRELIKEFQITKTSIDVKAMREKYLSLYPESRPVSTKSKTDNDQSEMEFDEENSEEDYISYQETISFEFDDINIEECYPEEDGDELEIPGKSSSLNEEKMFLTGEETCIYEKLEDKL